MINSENIVSAKSADFTRRVLDGETNATLFVSFTNPTTDQTVELRVGSIWEEAERITDYGYAKETRSNVVIKAALVEEKSATEGGASTWAVYLVKQYKYLWESQYSNNSNGSYELYKLNVDLTNTTSSSGITLWANWQSSSHTVAQFEKFVNADLNGDHEIGPQFTSSTPSSTDTSGLQFIRDSEGTPYLYDAEGKHKYFYSQESKNTWTYGGSERTVIAVEKGDPLRFIAQQAFDTAIAIAGTTRAQAFDIAVEQVVKTAFAFNNWWSSVRIDDKWISESQVFEAAYRDLNKDVLDGTANAFHAYKSVSNAQTVNQAYQFTFGEKDWSDAVFVVYREGNYNLQGEQKVFTDKRFIVDRLSDDLSSVQQSWNEAPVSWLEKYFGQDLNGDGVTQAGDALLTIVAQDVPAKVSKYFVAKDVDGRHYVLDSSDLESANLYRINDTWFARIQEDTVNRKAGTAVVSIFEGNDKDGNLNTYLLTKNFEKLANQAETVNSYTLYTVRFNKTEGGQIYSVDFGNNQWFDYNYDKSKFFDLEAQFDRDFNGDGQKGKGDPVIVKWVDDLIPAATAAIPKAVVATNAAGEVFIMEALHDSDATNGIQTGYAAKQVIDAQGNAARWTTNSSWETKSAYAVVKATLQDVKTAVGTNAWFPWGSENNASPAMNSGVGASLKLTDEAYFVAVKTVNNGTNISWQIFLVNSDGKFDPSALYINRISTIESVFQQDLNGDQQVGTPVPKEVEGPTKAHEFYSTDSVQAAIDSEGRIFVKDADLTDKSFMPVLNQWGGDSPQWTRKDAWNNWDSATQTNYKVERSSEVIGATKSVDDSGKRVYLIAVRERESSDHAGFVENTRWVIYKVYPKTPVQVTKTSTDPVYDAAYKAFTDAIAAGKTNLEAFDEAAKAAKVVAIKDGATEASVDKEIQTARTEFSTNLTNGLSAVEAFEKIFSDSNSDPTTTPTGTASTGAGAYYPGMYPSASSASAQTANIPENALLFSYMQENLKSITDKESLFSQDLNGDGHVGLDLGTLKLIGTDTVGTRLARESGGAIYVVEVDAAKKITSFKAITGNDWLENSYYQNADNYNKREAFAVVAVRDGLNITGYKLLLKSENKWGGQDKPQVTWDIYRLDKDGKMTWGHWDVTKNQWVDDSEYGITSIKSYENEFGQDLDGDGKQGISISDLTFEALDTNGARLARDNTKALYIVTGVNDFLSIKNASWLEYNNNWGWGSSDSKKAIAVQAATDGTGYWMALERKSQWGNNATATVAYDIVKIDTTGKVTWGYWDSSVNRWVDESQYNLNSLTAYEKIFNEDFNGDGYVGIDPKTLVWDVRDTTGVRLGRDKDKAIYVVDVAADGVTATDAIDIKGTSWLEYDSGWGYKREAVAVEKAEGGGYWLALKNTSTYWDYQTSTNKPQVTWDIYKLDDKARLTTGQYTNNQWVDETVYGAKSIAAYEELFNQDLNDDGIVGVDLSKLQVADTDNTGVRLARADDGGLYFVTQYGTADQKIKAIKDGWLEYDYSSGDWVSRRKAVAIEQSGDGFILALKNTSTQWNGSQYEVKNSWDVMHLGASGKTLYGYWNSTTNQWVEQSEWGVSIANYEIEFDQDLNGDGVKGIDISKLTAASTDHSDANGVRLYRDNDRILYIVNASQATPIKNSSWMEYKYAWGDSSNARTAIAAEQLLQLDSNGKPIYKVLFKYESKWGSGSDSNWEVITVDSSGRQLWTEGASVWTRNTKVVESMLNEDLNDDKFVGPDPSDLQSITTDTANPYLKMDKSDETLYVVDEGKLKPIIDRYGSPVDLSRDVDWGGGIVKYRPYAVSKIVNTSNEFVGYRLLVKVDKAGSSASSWEIYTVSTQGVIDLYNIKTTKFIDRYELEFNQDIDGVNGIGVADISLSSETKDTGNSILGRQLVGSEVVGLYAQVGGKQILLTNKNGGFPAIEYNRDGEVATVVATEKLDLGSGKSAIKVAVKIETTVGANVQTKWDVYHFEVNATGEEALLDRGKTLHFGADAVKSVEVLVNQNLEEGDTSIGYPLPKPVAAQVEIGKEISSDVGGVKAGVDASNGWLYIMLSDKNLAVVDSSGQNVKLGASLTYQEQINGFVTDVTIKNEVFAGTAVYTTGTAPVLDSYLVLVREKTTNAWTDASSAKQTSDSFLWKLYSVDKTGIIDLNYTAAAKPNRWASIFSEDVDGKDGVSGNLEVQNFGVANDDPDVLPGFKDIRVSGDDFYLKDSLKGSEKFLPILLENQSSIDFVFKTSLGDGELTSEIKGVAQSETVQDEFFMAVQRTYVEGSSSSTSFLVYTIDAKEDALTHERYAEVQSADTYVTDDLTTFKVGGNAIFAASESVS